MEVSLPLVLTGHPILLEEDCRVPAPIYRNRKRMLLTERCQQSVARCIGTSAGLGTYSLLWWRR
jgi:hypothetical protein